ncbi:MAG: HNH endonuclease [Gemmatimonadaceae bacterium]|jgi:5-methylcytosine-specific restriction endonuclease McrA|nr:HNH endonuclease [Gemmatimonadaceae bacterium]
MLEPSERGVVSQTPPESPALPAQAARPGDARLPGTMASGEPFPDRIVDAVWERAAEIPGFDPQLWRLDARNEAICRFDHGVTGTPFGWEIDHVVPVSLGGTDALANLQALRIATNRRKGDTWPWHGP